jgi:hypothetical protein
MSTPLLCVLYELCLHITVIRVWLHRTRMNKSYLVIPFLVLNPLHLFYSLSACELKSCSLFQFPHYIFCLYICLTCVKMCYPFSLYLLSRVAIFECSWKAPILFAEYFIIIIDLSWSWATCWPVPVSRIQKSLQRTAMIPSARWGIAFHYPG